MRSVAAIGLILCAAMPAPAQPFAGFGSGSWNPLAAPQPPHPAVVRVIAPEGEGSMSLGSGTVVACTQHHALVVTNWHVVRDARAELTVVFPDGFRTPGTVLKVDRDWDLAAVGILRPAVAPVPLASAPPQPGELLTIAGYGPGPYRSVSGRCLQYLSPAPNLPYDIIELAASARNGDSGGPIFNNRGELAGVLFGEGGGATSGSHSGRVRWFLSSLVAPAPEESRSFSTPLVSAPMQRETSAPSSDPVATPPVERSAPQWATAAPSRPETAPWALAARESAVEEVAESTPAWDKPESWQSPPEIGLPPPNHSLPASTAEPQVQSQEASGESGWELLTGASPFEKVKSFFAAVGVLAILMQLSRQMKNE